MAKLLVVDDEVGIRELLSEILEDEGHDVLTAEDAGQARKLIEENPLDLILLDIWMPDTDGVTLLRELSSQHLIHCPVIMMSGHATIDTAVEATKFGAFDFLEKPISMQRLLSSVSNALAQETPADTESRQQDAETQSEPSEAKAVIYGHNGNELATIPFTLELRDARDSFEKLYLQSVLEEESYSMSKVAARTGLERTHLYRKLKQRIGTRPKRDMGALHTVLLLEFLLFIKKRRGMHSLRAEGFRYTLRAGFPILLTLLVVSLLAADGALQNGNPLLRFLRRDGTACRAGTAQHLEDLLLGVWHEKEISTRLGMKPN